MIFPRPAEVLMRVSFSCHCHPCEVAHSSRLNGKNQDYCWVEQLEVRHDCKYLHLDRSNYRGATFELGRPPSLQYSVGTCNGRQLSTGNAQVSPLMYCYRSPWVLMPDSRGFHIYIGRSGNARGTGTRSSYLQRPYIGTCSTVIC